MISFCKKTISKFLNLENTENQEYILDLLLKLCDAIKFGLDKNDAYILTNKLREIIKSPVKYNYQKEINSKYISVETKEIPKSRKKVELFFAYLKDEFEIINFNTMEVKKGTTGKISTFILDSFPFPQETHNINVIYYGDYFISDNNKQFCFKKINDILLQYEFLFGKIINYEIKSCYDMYNVICNCIKTKEKIIKIMSIS